jgi:hypothetical protein
MSNETDHEKDLLYSIDAIEKIRLTILPKLISGNILNNQIPNDLINKLLDRDAGFDYFREDKNGMQGIASRVQFDDSFNSFTIRLERDSGNKTEFEKRKFAIENGYMYPEFTMHSYFDNRINLNLISIAIIKTIDLFNYHKMHPNDFLIQTSKNAVFYSINWNYLKDLQIKIYKEVEKEKYNEIPF